MPVSLSLFVSMSLSATVIMSVSASAFCCHRLTSGSSRTRLLYVTPEKVAKSDVLMRALNALRAEGRLARVVVDEAHCVSQVNRGRGRREGVRAWGMKPGRQASRPQRSCTRYAFTCRRQSQCLA